jgi:integrase
MSDKYIRSIRPVAGRRLEVFDALVPQMSLRITENGHRSWNLVGRFGGGRNPTRRKLGDVYDGDPVAVRLSAEGLYERAPDAALTLGEARTLAHLWLGLVSRGVDPAGRRKTAAAETKEKEAARLLEAKTLFDNVAAEWVRRRLDGLKHELQIERLVEREFVGRWHGRPIASISRAEYQQEIRAIADGDEQRKPAPWQTHTALGILRRLLSWAEQSGEFGPFESPLRDVTPSAWIDHRREPRSRILNADEMRAVWHAAVAEGYPWGDAVRLLMLTGQRLREIADLSWPEIKLEERLITIPAERMKGKAAHEVPLAPHALALLQGVPRWNGPFVFSLRGGIRPVGAFDRIKDRLDKVSGVSAWRLHDLRRSARSGFSALAGFEDVHREAVLDHRRNGIARVYDLHKYYDEKLALLTAWEQRLLGIVEAGDKAVAA